VRPLDFLDQQYLSLISLPSCKDSTASPDLIVSSLSLPSKAGAGSTISVTDTIKNQGGGRAGAFTIKFYLSTNTTYGAGDILLGSRAISSLAPGATSSGSTFVTIPFGTTAGTYYIVGKADAEEVVLETNEGNNAKFKKFKYKATTIY
jgi:subtilase family serine protease